jgi:hypothetical protein
MTCILQGRPAVARQLLSSTWHHDRGHELPAGCNARYLLLLVEVILVCVCVVGSTR